ncbi:hypothetical protein M569_08301, partial [Genlisea aurea]
WRRNTVPIPLPFWRHNSVGSDLRITFFFLIHCYSESKAKGSRMSRCFPFPPPGYERKPKSEDWSVLKE